MTERKNKRGKGTPVKTRKLDDKDSGESGAALSGSSLEMPVSEEVGRTINGRYEITRVIGEGGMGVVYEAYDRQVDRNVAIKVVRAECVGDRKFLSRFRREMAVTTDLRHPSTIRVFEHGEAEDGRPYMVMELLQGESLADRLEQGKVPELEALQYAKQIAESLSEAHENGIFHRDLKPDNIFIETVGVTKVVKVLDFGIAGGIDATRLTQAGEVFGTPQYMSPEQCNGLPLDHRTDIYSLGCMLYEMIEGRPPFSAESPMSTMLKHVRSKVPPPKHCTRETAKVLQMALRKDRNKRIQDCGRFAVLIGECIGAARANRLSDDGDAPSTERNVPKLITAPVPSVLHDPVTGPINVGQGQGNLTKILIGAATAVFVGVAAWLVIASMGGDGADDEAVAEADEAAMEASSGEGLPRNRALIKANLEGASVLLDDVIQCQSPCFIEVPIGDGLKHEIRLRKEGYVDVVQTWEPSSPTEKPPEFPDLRPSTETADG